jgi:hypothetical protein
MSSLFHRAHLLVLTDTAVNQRLPERDVLSIGMKTLADLNRQLACGCEHQRQRAAGGGTRGIVAQVIKDRQCKGGGFSGARLSATQDILAFDRRRNGLGLNRRRLGVFQLGESLLERSKQVHFLK